MAEQTVRWGHVDSVVVSAIVWCPACEEAHRLPIINTGKEGGLWTWDGNKTSPTFSPSLLVHETPTRPRCHSFIQVGEWHYLTDSTHSMAGQVVPFAPLPIWLRDK